MKVNFIGHRGISVYHIPENTRPAIRRAFDEGFDVETDVQWLSDDRATVLYHDNYIPSKSDKNLNGGGFYLPGKKLVYDCEPDELSKAKFSRTKLERLLSAQAGRQIELEINEEPKIATLDDLLPIPNGRRVFLEIKRAANFVEFDDGMVEVIAAWIKRHKLQKKVVIISFNPHDLSKIRDLLPDIEIGIDICGPYAEDLDEATHLRKQIGIKYWNPPFNQTTKELVSAIQRKAKLEVVPWVWGEDMSLELDEIRRLKGLGLRNIITNQPKVADLAFNSR